MAPRQPIRFFLLLLLAGCVGLCVAQDAEVRIYTNADLERFPELPASEVRANAPSSDEWRFVTEYLDRQYARLDADRKFELERERSEAETEWVRRRADRPAYALPFYWPGCHPARRPSGKRPDGGSTDRLLRAAPPGGSIRPLHAGPTRAQIDYFKATRRSGADAFPSNARSR